MPQPQRGMVMVFKAESAGPLAGLVGTIRAVWPRFRSGDYLVTLEFPQPVPYGTEVITELDVFLSELEPVPQPLRCRPACSWSQKLHDLIFRSRPADPHSDGRTSTTHQGHRSADAPLQGAPYHGWQIHLSQRKDARS